MQTVPEERSHSRSFLPQNGFCHNLLPSSELTYPGDCDTPRARNVFRLTDFATKKKKRKKALGLLTWVAYLLCKQPQEQHHTYFPICTVFSYVQTVADCDLVGCLNLFNTEFFHWLPFQQRIQCKINTLCYKCATGTAPSTSVTVFNFTHPPVHSARLLILSASRFLAPDSPLLVPAPFLFSVHQHGMTFPFLSDRNPPWTHSKWKLHC